MWINFHWTITLMYDTKRKKTVTHVILDIKGNTISEESDITCLCVYIDNKLTILLSNYPEGGGGGIGLAAKSRKPLNSHTLKLLHYTLLPVYLTLVIFVISSRMERHPQQLIDRTAGRDHQNDYDCWISFRSNKALSPSKRETMETANNNETIS